MCDLKWPQIWNLTSDDLETTFFEKLKSRAPFSYIIYLIYVNFKIRLKMPQSWDLTPADLDSTF